MSVNRTSHAILGSWIAILSVTMTAGAGAQAFRALTYGESQGFPSNLTKSVIEDDQGYVWIATDAGLARFDGHEVSNFTHQLRSPYVKNLLQTRDRKLYVVTDKGIMVSERSGLEAAFRIFLVAGDAPDDTTLFYPKAIYEDQHGRLWISEPGAVVLWEQGCLTRFPFSEEFRTDSYTRSFQLVENTSGIILAVSERGYIFIYNERLHRFIIAPHASKPAHDFLIDAVIRLDDGTVLAGGSKGVFEIVGSGSPASINLIQRTTLPGVSSLTRTGDGLLFAGTWKRGLYRLVPAGETMQPERIADLPLQSITSIRPSQHGGVWVSSDDGIGFVHQMPFERVPMELENLYIESLLRTPDGEILATDGRSVFALTRKNDQPVSHKIFSPGESLILSLAGSGRSLLLGFRDGFVVRRKDNVAQKLAVRPRANRLIDNILQDSEGDLWICEDAFPGVRCLRKDGSEILYDADRGVNAHINVIRQAVDGTVFLGGAGTTSFLFRFDRADDRFVDISSRSVMVKDNSFEVNDLAIDRNSAVWVASNTGLYVYRDGKMIVPPGADGLQGEILKAVVLDGKENVWIGTDHGVARLAHEEISWFDNDAGLLSTAIAFRAMIVDEIGSRVGRNVQRRVCVARGHGESRHLSHADGHEAECRWHGTLGAADRDRSEFEYGSFLDVSAVAVAHPSDRTLYQWRLDGEQSTWSSPVADPQIVIPKLTERQAHIGDPCPAARQTLECTGRV